MLRRDFLTLTLASAVCSATSLPSFGGPSERKTPRNTILRGTYANSKRTFETTRRGRVAFLGGSITEMDGYRPMVCSHLQEKFPHTDFEFVASGLGSTCSDFGAFRLETDILQGKDVDLFFVEYAVNDGGDGEFDYEHSLRGYEGIVRHIRKSCPNVDIVGTLFVTEPMMDACRAGEPIAASRAHLDVAKHYDYSMIDLTKEIQEEIDAGEITWEEYGGIHPAPRGNRICADMIAGMLDSVWDAPTAGELAPHPLPDPIDPNSYFNGGYRGWEGVETNVGSIFDASSPDAGGFRLSEPDWERINGYFRPNYGGRPFLCGTRPDASFAFDFEGNAAGCIVLAGPDAGVVEYRVDEGEWQKVNLFRQFSGGLHYPYALIFADGLSRGTHRVETRILEERDARSNGNVMRLMEICVNR